MTGTGGSAVLERQLVDRSGADVLSVVQRVVGLNAQTARGPSVGLWARIDSFDQEQLDVLLRDYRLVKANLMRGTVHMVTARQYRCWRRALQPALERTVKQFFPRVWQQVDHDHLLREGTALLADHDGLTRAELGRLLEPKFPDADPKGLAFAIRLLCPVVQVADPTVWNPGRTRYVLASSVLGDDFADEQTGLADLLSCYLQAYGPATAADASYFSSLTGLAEPLKDIGKLVVAGRTAVFDLDADRRPVPDAVLLPEYDNVLFAHKDGPLREDRRRLIKNTATVMQGPVFWRGRVVAGWYRKEGDLVLDPWEELTDEARRAFDSFQAWYTATDREIGARPDHERR